MVPFIGPILCDARLAMRTLSRSPAYVLAAIISLCARHFLGSVDPIGRKFRQGGVPVALIGVQVLKTLLFGVPANDPGALAVSTAALFGAAAIATILPLWRATRVSQLAALSHE